MADAKRPPLTANKQRCPFRRALNYNIRRRRIDRMTSLTDVIDAALQRQLSAHEHGELFVMTPKTAGQLLEVVVAYSGVMQSKYRLFTTV